GEAESDEHHAELGRAWWLGPEPEAGRERNLRAVRRAGLGDQEQRRQRDQRERAPPVRPGPRARAPHCGYACGEEDEGRHENERRGERERYVNERHRAKR